MRILVSGSTGFLGTAIVDSLQKQNHLVARIVRPGSAGRNKAADPRQEVSWDPIAGHFDAASAEESDALIHLAGASIADGRWSDSRKKVLRTSRIDATRHLMGALGKLQSPPRIIVAASAVGYYGSRGDETLTEQSAPGSDFLAELCREWEAETARGAEFGARVVSPRFGIILSAHGGALPRMALPFKLGAGGRLGDGQQWMSWLTLAEVVNIVQFALANSQLAGPVNAITPNPVRNSEFTTVLAKTLYRPALFPAPAFALRLALGEMADGLLLASQRVIPSRLISAGYQFQQPDLAEALADVFRK
ncbi:MAG TPA: TIGR01777 family oxidoreductase [Candidatus Acidoferrales bacterium]|nr:TIGR01777 family oxidoreductase [Candidatus Acidoferrales bacterium]